MSDISRESDLILKISQLRADLSALKGERGRMESALMSIKSQCAGHADAFSERVYLIAVDAINHKEPT